MGPTAAGKTSLALDLAEALGGELVGCDALQVYRRFDIATAKPSAAERARVPYHLIDELEPAEDFTLARFIERAEGLLEEIRSRDAQPILVGGTGMYLRGLLRGIVPAPEIDPALRRRLAAMQERRGARAMHRWLERVDPDSASRIGPGDRQRVGRALEWWLASGTRWSERLDRQGTWESANERYRCLKLGLEATTEWLTPRIERRVEGFFAAGLEDEVRGLLAAGVSPECNAFQAIGYREVVHALRHGESMDGVIERVKVHTRRYAKRQRTWFRREPGIVWLDAASTPDALLSAALEAWTRFVRESAN